MRVALTLAYNGTSFLGSQTQSETSNTVLGKLESVLSLLGISSRAIASGRTDKGVHATGQVCHIDLPAFWSDIQKLRDVLNQKLPKTIRVTKINAVDPAFHARYSAKKRVYRYIIKQAESNPFEEEFVTFDKNIDFESVAKNIKLFVGEHDFAGFMKTGSDVGS
ncbi:MAG: tRNA pseudouridine synthase A, partial [Sulfurimonas sp.]|nr:tRNA pseudouridine synthase A [Sulfurimonas sp.]